MHPPLALRLTGAVAALAALLALAAPTPAHAAKRTVPQGFLGVTADGPLSEEATPRPGEFRQMARNGVEIVRIGMSWNLIQPYETATAVPAGRRGRFRNEDGVPTDWAATDALVAAAASRRMEILPTLSWCPRWAALHPGVRPSPPADPATYARFVASAAKRYGPGGTFWAEHATLPSDHPIRLWQVWNEPNQRQYGWTDQPFAAGYVALMRATRGAVKAVDPDARIVLAGLVGPSDAVDLQTVYAAGGKGLFDVADMHPFAPTTSGVLRIMDQVRRTMDANDDRDTPLSITELTWPAAVGKLLQRKYGFETDERTQASNLDGALTRLVRDRARLRLEHVFWYTWLSQTPSGVGDAFDYSGLRALLPSREVVARPSLAVYKRVARRIEGCRKTVAATRCAH